MDDMNSSEELVKQTEQKMLYKFLNMIKESKDLQELENKVKAKLEDK